LNRLTKRDPNLDLLRAAAVTAVVAAHLPVLSPVHRPALLAVTWAGQFGVDLFFVLSGWLISGLYFRDRTGGHFGGWWRFVARRALRTVPPYYVALLAAWLAARWFRGDHPAFDPSYLVFLQNYLGTLPYFSVSWSLCIEEHFYLALPAALACGRIAAAGTGAALLLALAISPLCRTLGYPSPSIDVFDSSVLATHTHLDGLVMGVAARWLQCFRPSAWARVRRLCRRGAVPALLLLPGVYWIPPRLFYDFGYTYLAVLFAVLVGALAGARPRPGATGPAVRALALGSYSIYLTHALALHAAQRLARGLAGLRAGEWAYYAAAVAGTAALGGAFYWSVERPSLRLRDRWIAADAAPAGPPQPAPPSNHEIL
jgi:peptidoglycan/LPS O-acetylase OafA/YrhL